MPTPLINAIARFFSWLPLSANQWVGAAAGWLAWQLKTRPRKITEINLQLCFPAMDATERQQLARSSLIQTGRQLTECAWIWNRPREHVEARVVEVTGKPWLDEAIASPEGTIIVSPHIGNWEMCSLPLSQLAPFTYFYRKPRNHAMEKQLIKWRGNLGGEPALLDASGIRNGLRVLKKGGVIGILPDQEPDIQNGLFAPFFGQHALTMTLLSKLANRSGAHVLLCISERLSEARGWRIHFLKADPHIAHPDLPTAVAAVNRDVERCVSLCPDQYLWDYKRFKTRPDGSAMDYKCHPLADYMT